MNDSPEQSSSPCLLSEDQQQAILQMATAQVVFVGRVYMAAERFLHAVGIDPAELVARLNPSGDNQPDASMAASGPASRFRPAGSEDLHHS